MKIYASWSEGLAYNKEALGILESSGVIDGVELWNTDGQAERIRDAGLEVCYHTPGGTSNLMDPKFRKAFANGHLLDAIRASECPVVGFHCGYSNTRIIKNYRIHQVEVTGEPITDREVLLREMTKSFLFAKGEISDYDGSDKLLAIENLVHHREDAPINRLYNSPVNTGKDFITEPDFIEELLDKAGALLILDIPHALITGDTRGYNMEPDLRGDAYLNMMLWIGEGKIGGLHINRPGGGYGIAYSDHHMPLIGDEVSEHVLEYAERAIEDNPGIYFTTLEMDTGKGPVQHARIMVEQAELYRKRLKL